MSRVLPPSLLFALATLAACSDQKVGAFNAPPEAQITSPADGATALAGTPLTLRGAASDANHDAAELNARWFVDDTEACAATPAADGSTNCDIVVPDATALDVRLEVTDPDGAAGTASITLAVTPNAAPTATIASPLADGVYYSDQLVTFRGTVADAEDAATALTVWWEDGATRLDAVEATPTTEGEVLGYSTLAEGAHALELHVLDTAGHEGIATTLIDVGPPNAAPTCAIVAPADGGASADGERVDFAAQVADADVSPDRLIVEWSSDKDGVIGTSIPDSDGSVDFATSALSVNAHRITLRVTDEVGATCTQSIGWTVGTPPTVTLEAPTPDELVNAGDNLLFSALVTDNEDVAADLTVTWESSLDGVFYEGPPDSAGVAQFIESGLSVGDHVLTVTVTDTTGLYATALGSFTVNGGPSAPGVSIAPASPLTDDDLTVAIDTASVDPDGDPVTYAYAWSVDGVASSASTSAVLPASATSRGQVWTAAVTASDGLTTSAAGSASVTIGDTAPVAAAALTPASPTRGSTLTCAGSGSDADGDALTYSFAWTVDGAAVAATSTGASSATLATGFDDGAVVVCTVTVSDGAGGTDTAAASVTIGNTAPVVSVTLTPAAPRTDSTLTAGATASDADGDALTLTYAWYVDGALVQSGAAATLDGAAFDAGQDVYVVVTADDGATTGTATSATVTVADTAPVVSVTLAPSSPQTDDTLTATATGSDADGDGLTWTYDWYVDGALVQSGASATISGASFSRDQDVYVVATADDGTTAAAATSATVTVRNTAPVVTAVSITPSSPMTDDTLTATAAGSDADADALTWTYDWYVGGVRVQSGASATLSGASFSRGQSVYVTVLADDGTDTGSATSASVTVGDTAPTTPGVAIAPTAPIAGDALTCSVTTASTDADGETPTYTFTWDVDGVAYTGASSTATTSTVPGADVAYPDTWTCTVTASDGTRSSGAASATVSVDFPYTCTEATYGSSDYLFCTDKLEWNDAEAACVSWGGHLATVNDAGEDSFLLATGAAVLPFASGGLWWIGFTDALYEGSFGWVSSGGVTYTNWGTGEPNNTYGGGIDEDCTVLIWSPSGYRYGSWNDLPCAGTPDSDQTFICEG